MNGPGKSLQERIGPHRLYPDFLAPDEHAALLDVALASESQTEARSSRSLRDLRPMAPVLRERLLQLLPRLSLDLGMPPFEASRIELEMVAYAVGDRFRNTVSA